MAVGISVGRKTVAVIETESLSSVDTVLGLDIFYIIIKAFLFDFLRILDQRLHRRFQFLDFCILLLGHFFLYFCSDLLFNFFKVGLFFGGARKSFRAFVHT